MGRPGSFFGVVCLLGALRLLLPAVSRDTAVPGGLAAGQAEAALTVTPTPQLPQVIVRENFIQ